jgi:anti-anti-sigma regulatory factor
LTPLATAPHPHPFSVRREDAGRVPVLVVTGGMDAQAAPQLSAAVCAFGSERIVVDLHEVDDVDPDGLRDVLLASRVCAVGLHVVCPAQAPVRRLLEARWASAALSVHESRADALSRIAERRAR